MPTVPWPIVRTYCFGHKRRDAFGRTIEDFPARQQAALPNTVWADVIGMYSLRCDESKSL